MTDRWSPCNRLQEAEDWPLYLIQTHALWVQYFKYSLSEEMVQIQGSEQKGDIKETTYRILYTLKCMT